MKSSLQLLVTVLIASNLCICSSPNSGGEEDFNLYVLKNSDRGFEIGEIPISNGQKIVLKAGKNGEILDLLLPISPGVSGNIVSTYKESYLVEVERSDGIIRTKTVFKDGKTKSYPDILIEDLLSYNFRVNITTAAGSQTVFEIQPNISLVKQDHDSPVIDLFAGKIPLNKGDYSITTQTTVAKDSVNLLTGSIPLEWVGPWLWTRTATPEGQEGIIMIDYGASGSVVLKDMIADRDKIKPLVAIQYSDKVDTLDGKVQGAGGSVGGILGRADLKNLPFGGLVIEETQATVMNDFAELEKMLNESMESGPVMGIAGNNILQLSQVSLINFDREYPVLYFNEKSKAQRNGKVVSIPFNLVRTNIFVKGFVDGIQVNFMVDTGARTTVIPPVLNSNSNQNESKAIRGLDGMNIESVPVVVEKLTLGGSEYSGIKANMARLPVFDAMGLGENTGLLGIDFLTRFDYCEIDIPNKMLRLWNDQD